MTKLRIRVGATKTPARQGGISVSDRAADEISSIFAAHSRPCVVTMGVFDGVHRGHRALIASARRGADDLGLPLMAVTFSPRPDQVLRPESALPDLCSLQTRVSRLQRAGADAVVILPFSPAVAAISAELFARLLVDDLGLRRLCVGADFALGSQRSGDVHHLRATGLEVVTVPFVLARPGEKISSSALRRVAAGLWLPRAPSLGAGESGSASPESAG